MYRGRAEIAATIVVPVAAARAPLTMPTTKKPSTRRAAKQDAGWEQIKGMVRAEEGTSGTALTREFRLIGDCWRAPLSCSHADADAARAYPARAY